MSRFSYIARDANGVLFKGVLEAADMREVRSSLRQKGYYPTSIRSIREWKLSFLQSIKNDEVTIFAEQLSVMVEAGLSLVKCMTTLADQTKNVKFKQIINGVSQDVQNGVSFAESLGKHPKVFSRLFINLVKSGETGGVLGKSLRQIADYMDNERQIKQKVNSALTYPKIVIVICALVIIFLSSFVVPAFMKMYESMKVPLPLPTKILILASSFFTKFVPHYWWLLVVVGGGIYYGYKKFRSSTYGKDLFDRARLYMPFFGDLGKKMVVSRLIKVISALTMSGVPIMQTIEIAREVADNTVMDLVVGKIRASINAGGGLKGPVSDSDLFPPMVKQMVGMGEEVGNIGEALEKSAKFLDREIDDSVKRLMTKIEPATTVVIGGIVCLILLALYIPMFDLMKMAK